MTLSRRDRAAMSLALECLRDGQAGDAIEALALGVEELWLSSASNDVHEAFCAAWRAEQQGEYKTGPSRLLRARLTLVLRVLLRADRGDFGLFVCHECGRRIKHIRGNEGWCARCGLWALDRDAIRPLWCDAPAHKEAA